MQNWRIEAQLLLHFGCVWRILFFLNLDKVYMIMNVVAWLESQSFFFLTVGMIVLTDLLDFFNFSFSLFFLFCFVWGATFSNLQVYYYTKNMPIVVVHCTDSKQNDELFLILTLTVTNRWFEILNQSLKPQCQILFSDCYYSVDYVETNWSFYLKKIKKK